MRREKRHPALGDGNICEELLTQALQGTRVQPAGDRYDQTASANGCISKRAFLAFQMPGFLLFPETNSKNTKRKQTPIESASASGAVANKEKSCPPKGKAAFAKCQQAVAPPQDAGVGRVGGDAKHVRPEIAIGCRGPCTHPGHATASLGLGQRLRLLAERVSHVTWVVWTLGPPCSPFSFDSPGLVYSHQESRRPVSVLLPKFLLREPH